ncbi:MAG: precorrin-8X methylmutase [Spirochaetaceae bacterium]|jgi:precorrin-8X/cobalt-precorrin-8 methylmutase|nr:precorrin-8X methylmutase [Spirochaetaceae bacterium]
MNNTYAKPEDIENRSFEIIGGELAGRRGGKVKPPLEDYIVKRVIHTTADFDFDDNLVFTRNAAGAALELIRSGVDIVTDTRMAMIGINKSLLSESGGAVHCFIADADVAAAAKRNGITRSRASMDKAALLAKPLVFAIGNAPTALIRIRELIDENKLDAKLVIAAAVGFVNVVEAKELFLDAPLPCIIARGRKGGSAVAAAIVNAVLVSAFRPAALQITR